MHVDERNGWRMRWHTGDPKVDLDEETGREIRKGAVLPQVETQHQHFGPEIKLLQKISRSL
jgi:hypothetical protein